MKFEYRDIGMVRNASKEHCKRMKVYLDPTPHVVLSQNVPLRGWYKPKHEVHGARPRPCYTEALLTQPYGGTCPTGCLFCYVNNGQRGYRSQGISVVDPRYPEKIEKQLQGMRTASAFYISSFTEPFQSLEAIYHNTQRTAAVAVKAGLPLFFLTRQIPPDWTIDYLRKNPYSYMQFSINTPNSKDWKKLSPGAAPLEALLDSVEQMSKAGIYVSIQVNPIVAGITTTDHLRELVHLLAGRGANHLIFKYVEIVSPSVKRLINNLGKAFPDRVHRFKELFSETIGHVRTIQEEYRIAGLKKMMVETEKVGVTMGLCYEYWYKRDLAGKIIDRAGESLGPLFTTGDQCHGRAIPVYTRRTVEDRWRPILNCDPGGCLYCADRHPAGVPCGNSKMGLARALSPADLKEPVIP